jgi:feruloyl-CoA synthase
VSVGPLRARILGHFAPLVRDCVIAGLDRDDVGMLVFPDFDACRKLCGDLASGASAVNIVAHESVQRAFTLLLRSFAASSTGSSNCIARAILMTEPPSLDAGEITDKGSLNHRVILERRAELVVEMYADGLGRVIRL